MKCAIVGLPNVGKSTFFNALLGEARAAAENFPFCTIEPNIARVAVADPRLDALAELAASRQIVPATLEFVDVAGLIAGASKGEGLGNKFLAHIRQSDLILHLVRAFADEKVGGEPSPLADIETINTELILADLETIAREKEASAKAAKSGDGEAALGHRLADKLYRLLDKGAPARMLEVGEEEAPIFGRMRLLTAKPTIYIANVDGASVKDGNEMSKLVMEAAAAEGIPCFLVAAAMEAELNELGVGEKARLLEAEGIVSSLARVIKGGYDRLGLITFFTVGEKETRAWTIARGSSAPLAAGRIHSDMRRGFISAEVISHDGFIAAGGIPAAKRRGLLRLEGKNYIIQDGDVVHFRFNV